MAKKSKNTRPVINQNLKNILAWILLGFLWLIVISWNNNSWVGSFLIDILTYLFWDYFRFIFAPVLILLWIMISINKINWNYTRLLWLFIYFLAIDSLVWMLSKSQTWIFDFNWTLVNWFWTIPAAVLLFWLTFLSIYLLFRISYIAVIKKVSWQIWTIKDKWVEIKEEITNELKEKSKKKNEYKEEIDELNEKIKAFEKMTKQKNKQEKTEQKNYEEIKRVPIEKKSVLDFFASKKTEEKPEPKKWSQMTMTFNSWEFPSIELLQQNNKKYKVDYNQVEKKSFEIRKTLLQFKIDVEMKAYTVWPTVIQYRLKPSEWVKLNKIENLKKDLTLALKAKSIRIEAPIPWLWLVWIEVPNDKRETVVIRDIIASKEFENHKSNLALVVGRNINWDNIVADLAKMPHLLIAWQTWSGKSVAMNGFIVSLLYKNSPDMLRLIMIDPKRVELSVYNWIPHLLAPIISDHEKALNSLKWCVAEMMRRYDMMTQLKSRNLDEYNKKVIKKERMPNIVVIIDELAELMWRNNKKDVENAITRIAQLGRAAWMHLLVATQRPSVDVITWLIKANIPSRIALTVASQVDSRTIIDQIGAEDLIWYWDMLFSPIWSAPERIQWVLVDTDEIESIVNHIKRTIDPNMLADYYDNTITDWESTTTSVNWIEWEYDEDPKVLEEAIQVVREAWKASTSLLQRRLKLGYARAARVIDILESMWIVGPADWSKPRDVY